MKSPTIELVAVGAVALFAACSDEQSCPQVGGLGGGESVAGNAATGGHGGFGGVGGAITTGGQGGPGGGGTLPFPQPIQEGLIRGVDDQFWANMDDFIFTVVQPSDVRLYATLISAGHYHQQPHRALGIELVRHPESFFANAVLPFLDRYVSSGVIWAVDCMNEPEGLIAGADGNYETWGVSWNQMRAFLAYCASTIHEHYPDLPVSAGSGWHNWDNILAGRYQGLGFDFLDYHYYSDAPAPLSPSALGVSEPVVIGECGQYSEVWDDSLQQTAVTSCFTGARDAGYLAAMSWYYNYAGSDNHHTHLNADGSWRPVKSAFETIGSDPNFQAGLNLAWLSGAYDHDFGVNPLHPTWSVAYDHAAAQGVIADYDGLGIGLMRLWLFEAQEALPFHMLYDDFENDTAYWTVTDPTALSASLIPSFEYDGEQSLVITVAATTPGWYGIAKTWSTDTPRVSGNTTPVTNSAMRWE